MKRSRTTFGRGLGQRVLGVLFLLLLVTWRVGAGELPPGQTAQDKKIADSVTTLLRMVHLTGQPLDDKISRRCMRSFLESLDPMKVYFYQSDVDAMMKNETLLDDLVKRGDIGFAYTTFHKFLERVDERVRLVDVLLEKDYDFTLDEFFVIEPDLRKYPADAAAARELWRKRIKYDLLVERADGIEGKEAREKIARRYRGFASRMHQTDRDRLLELYLGALTTAFDPHTVYMSPRTLENFEISMRLELEGIGAALRWVDGYTTVSYILPGGAAERDGRLKPEDRIVAVGQGDDGEFVDVVEMILSDVVPMIRGPHGTVVRLKVWPAGESEKKVYRLVRARVELKDSEALSRVFEEGKKPNGTPYKVGVIDLPSFYRDMAGAQRDKKDFRSTTRDVRRILRQFKSDNVDVVVLDLRRNGGGSLREAIDLTGLFIDRGPVVQVRDPEGTVHPYLDTDRGVAWKGPLVVLTSKFSASASEILAGAIQDYGRGVIVGDRSTHGKGTVQTLLDLGEHLGDSLYENEGRPKWGALKITTQQFYRPSGESTQKRGVVADIELPSITTHLDVGEDDLDHAIEFDRVPPAQYEAEKKTSPGVVSELRRRSTQRVTKSEDFEKVRKRIQRYLERKNRNQVTLNANKFLAERKQLKEAEEASDEPDTNKPPDEIRLDYYLEEALAISRDYLELLNPERTVVH